MLHDAPQAPDADRPEDGAGAVHSASCASRLLLDQVADKWSILILSTLCAGPLRFNALRRRIEGVTQKALTQALRRLERNGMVERLVIASSPVAVEYRSTALGRSLKEPLGALHAWAVAHGLEVMAAREAFDAAGRPQAA